MIQEQPREPRQIQRRRVLDVEEALRWAVRDELPKRRGEGRGCGEPEDVSPMFRLCVFGGPIDNWAREPGYPAAAGDPHPDALRIEQCLGELAGLDLDQVLAAAGGHRRPDGTYDFGLGFAALVDQGEAVAGALTGIVEISLRMAKIGRRPDPACDATVKPGRDERDVTTNNRVRAWQWGMMMTPLASGATGEYLELMPAYADRRGYEATAHCRVKWTPDPQGIARERADYLVWWTAMHLLAEKLSGGALDTLSVLPPSAPARPWAGDRELGKPARILEDLSTRDLSYRRAVAEQRSLAQRQRMLGLRRGTPLRTAARRPAAGSGARRAAGMPVGQRA